LQVKGKRAELPLQQSSERTKRKVGNPYRGTPHKRQIELHLKGVRVDVGRNWGVGIEGGPAGPMIPDEREHSGGERILIVNSPKKKRANPWPRWCEEKGVPEGGVKHPDMVKPRRRIQTGHLDLSGDPRVRSYSFGSFKSRP